jgi:hypothetical protein
MKDEDIGQYYILLNVTDQYDGYTEYVIEVDVTRPEIFNGFVVEEIVEK